MSRALLLLFFVFFLAWGTDDHIDLSQCGETADCFARESCIDGVSKDSLDRFISGELKNVNCDVIIQMRFYSYNRFRVMLQLNASDLTETIADSDISLIQTELQFACTRNGPTANAKLFDISDNIYEWSTKLVFCAFTITTKMDRILYGQFGMNLGSPTLHFSLGSDQSLKYDHQRDVFWNLKHTFKCNPEVVKSSLESNGIFLRDQINSYAIPPIGCGQSKILIITRDSAQPTLLATGEKLKCNDRKWFFHENSNEILIARGEKFDAVCAERFCSLCPDLTPLTTPGCSPPQTSRDSDNCTIALCPSNQWLIDDGRVLSGEMECKQETERPNSRNAAWYLKTSDTEVKVTKAACFEKTACFSNADFGKTCPNVETMECIAFKNSDDKTKVFCDEGYELSWSFAGGGAITTTNITCHFETGKFRDDKSKEVPDAANVVCSKPKEEASVASQSSLGLTIGACFGGLLLLVFS